MNNLDFVSNLSSALTTKTLISGVGLLMLTMSARYAHTTNRIRELLKSRLQLLAAGQLAKDDLKLIDEEILLIFHRSKLLKRAILFVVMSAAFSGLLVLTSVIATVFGLNLRLWEDLFLFTAVGFIVISTVLFSMEVSISLRALGMTVRRTLADDSLDVKM